MKVFACFFWIGFPILGSLVALRVDNFTAFTNETIVDNSFWSFGRRRNHAYTDVQGIYEVQAIHGRFEDLISRHHIIVFKDGTAWESEHARDELTESAIRRMEFVSAKSGRPYSKVKFPEDVPR